MGLFSLFLIVFSSQKIMTRFKIREWFFTRFYADIHFLYLIRNLRYKEMETMKPRCISIDYWYIIYAVC